MKQLLLVVIGGGFGSGLRYLISKLINNATKTGFPYGTFTVNILGSLLIGIILGIAIKNQNVNENHTLLLATGFCGGFTTFSAFAYENYSLLKSGDFTSFAIYTLTSLIVGFLAVFVGIYITKFL